MKVLITSALPYANGSLHFGHLAGAYLPADCYARFQRSIGNDVCFMCGSDEYGVAISMSAELAKRTPKEHVDHFHEINKQLFEDIGISFDHYSRTTWPGHNETVIEFFESLKNKRYIEEQESERLFCEISGKFYADRYVIGTCPHCGYEKARGDECTSCGSSYEAEELHDPKSKIGNHPLSKKKTTHWYLRLDLFKEQLLEWLKTKNWKPNVVNFIRHYIEHLRPRAITRDMKWGIPVPDRAGKVFYVWFDAPIGYISATKEWSILQGNPDLWKKYWLDSETKLIQFIGKDNIPFHAVVFPSMLLGQEIQYKIVDELPANEFLHLEGKQFSKSEGWYVDVHEFLQKYSVDQLRYTLAANLPETQDSEFSWPDFQSRCNAELLGKLGNFIHRTVVFAQNNCDGKVPEQGKLQEVDREFLHQCEELVEKAHTAYSNFHIRKATQFFMELAQIGNVYFNEKKPWKLVKDPNTLSEMKTAIWCSLTCIKFLALVGFPIIPTSSESAEKLLGLDEKYSTLSWEDKKKFELSFGHLLGVPKPLFRKIEDEEILLEEKKLGSSLNA